MQSQGNSTETKDVKSFFVLILIINLFISLDHGIIPAATIQIQESLSLDNQQLGLLGSLVYAGTVVSGLVASYLFLKFNPQRILETSMAFMIMSLFGFTLQFDQTWMYYFCRFCTGAAQAPLIVYFPVWVDAFALENKTEWLTYLQSGVPAGVFLGYVISSIISNRWNWRLTFFLQITVLIPCTFLLSRQSISIIDVRPLMKSKQNQFERMSYWNLLKITLRNQAYCLITITLGMLYFTVTGIQFWFTNYLIKILKIDSVLVNGVFSIDSITGPVSGCIFGGIVTQYYGGYDSKNANYIILFSGAVACVASVVICVTDNFWLMAFMIWILLFIGGVLVPILTGMLLSSVDEGLRSFANSNTTTYVNLFGYLPAPIIYGYLTQIDPKMGIYCLMVCPLIATLCISISTYFTLKHWPNPELEQNSLEMYDHHSQRSSEIDLPKRYRSKSEDILAQVFDFHSIPISANIGTNLNYEIQQW